MSPRDTRSRSGIESKIREAADTYSEKDARLTEGVHTGEIVERTARDLLAEVTSEVAGDLQEGFNDSHRRTVEHNESVSDAQASYQRSEIDPFKTDLQRREGANVQDAGRAAGAAGSVEVGAAAEGLRRAEQILKDDADYMRQRRDQEDQQDRRATENAAQKVQNVRSRRVSLNFKS
jgi:hypothetical protein